jgi:hypothetical protein
MKTDANGNMQWAKRYNPNLCTPDFTKPQISGSNIYLPLNYTSFDNIEVLKTNMQGFPIWNYAYNGSKMSAFYDGVTDNIGNTFLSGFTTDTLGYIFKIDSLGNILWSYKYGKADSSIFPNLLLTTDGGILGYGYGPRYYVGTPSQTFVNLVKTDSLGRDGCEQPFSVSKTSVPLVWQNVGIKVYPVTMTQLDTILNFHSASIDTITECFGVATGVTNIEAKNVVNVYPNPSTGIFTLTFVGAQNPNCYRDVPATIEIYNVLGVQVLTETTPTLLPHSGGGVSVSYPINISYEPNGVYFYRVVAENGNLIGEGKVLIQK